MSTLQVVSIIFGMVCTAAATVYAMGKLAGSLVAKLVAHETLDNVRFETQVKMWEEVRDDIREIRNMAGRRRGEG